jgi:hypothetical protein
MTCACTCTDLAASEGDRVEGLVASWPKTTLDADMRSAINAAGKGAAATRAPTARGGRRTDPIRPDLIGPLVVYPSMLLDSTV